jgi:signal transduction histidine kinase
MHALPGRETVPYHLGWAGFALAYGLSSWRRWELVAALAGYTAITGALIVASAAQGSIEWEETTEIPLMLLLAALMVWHVHRRQAALAHATSLAERDVRASRDRERLMRLTSHELRTPLTIARGYVELVQSRSVDPEDRQDLEVVADELHRLSRVSDRLIRMIQLQDRPTPEMVDVDAVLEQAVERWQVVADRNWVVEATAGALVGSSERLRTCVDTLVENALRYTDTGDTIRLLASRRDDRVVLAVLDSGVGLTDEQISAINGGGPTNRPDGGTDVVGEEGGRAADPLAGTGLGLGIVRQIALARGGLLRADRAPDGGAALTVMVPARPPADAAALGVPVVEPGHLSTVPMEGTAPAER